MIAPHSFQARLLRARMFLGSRVFYRKFYENAETMRLDYNTHLKMGRRPVLETEAQTIHFVATHTTIPVPKVRHILCTTNHPRYGYLIMDHVKGKPLRDCWPSMSESTKDKVIEQLRNYIAELRALPPPQPGIVASVTGGPIWEPARIGDPRIGPFATHDDFHNCLRAGFTLSALQRFKFSWPAAIIHAHSLKYETKFTHGDLAGRNILCLADGTITCILDWETSGWFPEYWEFTKAHHYPSNGPDWQKRIGLITGYYPGQLLAEEHIFNYIETEPIEQYVYKES